jgi:phage/plasmid-like protein (TIGR03299 family)
VIDRAVTAAEAAELAGMNFDIQLVPSGGVSPITGKHKDNGRFEVWNMETDESLATVGSHYNVLPFGEAFDFMDTINPIYVAAGIRRGGKEGYMVVQAPEHLRVDLLAGEDPIDLYVVLRTSHDGSKKVEASVLGLQGRCTNMLSLNGFSRHAKRRWGITHTANMREKLAEAQLSLRNLDDYVEDLEVTAQRLAAIDIELEEARRILEWALPNRPRRDDNIDVILNLFQSSPTNGFPRTGWGLLHGLTEWMDWHRDSRVPDARFIGGLAGHGHKTVNKVASRVLSRAS